MAECPKCKRPTTCGSSECYDIEHCHGPGRNACRCVAAAHSRGLRDGVALAKEHADVDQGRGYGAGGASIDWSDVDHETSKLTSEASR